MIFKSRTIFLAIFFFSGVSLNVYANPQGSNVVSGNASFTSTPNTLTVNTSSNKTIINWNNFSIAANESTTFNQPSSSSVVLNRVVGIDPSSIFGNLSSNGSLVLVNPNGILFGPGSQVNAPAILASTLNISNKDFLNGNYKFFEERHKGSSYIINQGRLAASPGGYIALLSQAVNNQGAIIAPLGTVALAAGQKMTLALDSQSQISVVIDEAVKTEVMGPDGKQMKSAVANSGIIKARGGEVLLTAKVLNNVFDYAVNNSGVIEASSMQEHNGVVEFTASGAPVINTGKIKASKVNINVTDASFTNTGKIQANQVNINVPDSTLVNKGQIISRYIPNLPDSGNISLNVLNLQQDGMILADQTIDLIANNVSTTVPFQSTSSSPVIRANQVNITANNLGANGFPIVIDAFNIAFNKYSGDINITGSQGIGSSIMITGPPGGFGSLIYNSDANLILQANSGSIHVGQGASLIANNLTLVSLNGIFSTGSLITPNALTLKSTGDIYSLGVLESSSLLERGNTFQVGGTFSPGDANVKNADNALVYAANANVSGAITDPVNIIVNPGITLTMTGNTTFNAGSSFTMDPTATINGGGYNLSISAGAASILGNLLNINLLTLSSGSSGSFKLASGVIATSLINGSTLDLNGQSLKVTGTLTNNGTLKLIGNENPSIGTFTDNGTTIYYGSGAYYVMPLGVYNNLQIATPIFILGAPLTAVNLSADSNLSLNGNALIVTGYFENVGPIYGNVVFNNNSVNFGPINGNVTFNGNSHNYGAINGSVTFTGSGFNNGVITGNVIFSGTSVNYYGIINGNATFNGTGYNTTAPSGGVFTVGTNAYWSGTVNGTVYGSDGVAITSYMFDGTGYNDGTINGNATFNNSSYNHAGIVNGNAIFNGSSYNDGTINGNATFKTTGYYATAPSGGVFTIGTNAYWSGTVNGTVYGSDGLAITNYVFDGTSYINSTINGYAILNGNAAFNGTSLNNSGTINGNVTINNGGTLSMSTGTLTIAGNLVSSSGTFNPGSGTVIFTGSGTGFTITPGASNFNNLQFNNGTFKLTSGISAVNLTNNSTLDLNGQSLKVTGTLTNNGTLKLIGNENPSIGTFTDNGTTIYYGSGSYTITPLGNYDYLQLNGGTFTLGGALNTANLATSVILKLNGYSLIVNSTFDNYGIIDGNVTLNGLSGNYGTINGNATLNSSSYNVGTINGNATFNGTSFNEGTITGNATFNGTSYNFDTINGNATFNTTWYNATAPTGGIFTIGTNSSWLGIVNGITYGADGIAITTYVFNGASYNSGTINGNAIFNGTSYNNYGVINGSATFTGTNSTTSALNVSTLTITGTLAAGSNNITIGTALVGASKLTTTGNITFTGVGSIDSALSVGTLTFQNGGTASGAITATTLSLTGGTLTLGGNLTATNITIASGATLAAGSHTITSTGTFSNSGTLTTSGSGSNLVITGANLGNVTFTAAATSLLGKTYGILTLGSGGTASGAISATSLNLTGGTLTLGGNLTATNITIASGATLAAGANTITSTGVFINNGTLTTSGSGSNLVITGANLGNVTFTAVATGLPSKTYGTLTLASGGTTIGAITATALNLTGGTLILGGNLTATNITIASGATLTLWSNIVTSTGTFTNNGTITTSGTGSNLIITGTNLGNITFAAAAASLPTKSYGTLTLLNGGTTSGAITATTLSLTGGTLTLGGNLTATNITIASGTTLAAGSHTITSTGTFTNNGTLTTSGSGSNLAITGANLGNVTFTAAATSLPGKTYGTLTLGSGGTTSGAITATNLNLSGGTLTLGGNLTATNVTIASGATLAAGANTITTTGTFTNSGTLTTSGSGSNLVIAGANLGNVTFTAAATSLPSKTYGTLTLGSGGTTSGAITATNLNLTGGTLTLGGNLTATNITIATRATLAAGSHTITSTGIFSNSGTLTTSGSGSNLVITGANLGNVTFTAAATSLPGKTFGTLTLGSGGTTAGAITATTLNLTGGTLTLGGSLTAINITIASGAVLDLSGNQLNVANTLTNNGTLKLEGSETPSIQSFIDNGTTDYYGNGTNIITALGNYNNLQFNNGTFILGGTLKSTSLTNNTTLELNGQSLTVLGALTNNGVFELIGIEVLSINTFRDNGTTDYNGGGTYSIIPFGVYNNLQFNNGIFKLTSGITATNLNNNSIFDLNGQSLTVKGTLTNNGTFKLVGNETPAIGTFIDNGTTDYYGSSTYTIMPLGTYNNLQFDNGTFILGGTSVFMANGNITINPNVTLDLIANTSLLAGNSGVNGAFVMAPSATVTGNGYNLTLSSLNASTLGNINNVGLLSLNSNSISTPVTYTSLAISSFQVNKISHQSILTRSVGTGTATNPIMIYSDSNTPGGLEYISTSGLGLYYELANNIDASDTAGWNGGTGFVPIGHQSTPFTGSFNGNGFTISNLTINYGVTSYNNPAADYVGLFGYTSTTAVITNAQLININVSGYDYVGGLVGVNLGTIKNSYTTGSINGNDLVGGLVGWNAYLGTIIGSYSNGNVNGSGDAGGLVGDNAGTINSSYSTGSNILGDVVNILNGSSIGGLAGSNEGAINSSYSTNNVSSISSNSEYIGGLVGTNIASITNSYSTGSVSGATDVGGLVGVNDLGGSITNSYSIGSVTGSTNVGGLVGQLGDPYGNGGDYGNITNSFTTGTVNGSTNTGGLVGESYNGSITNSYFTDNAYGNRGGGTYVSAGASAFYSTSNPVYAIGSSGSWDISTPIWVFSGGLPILAYQQNGSNFVWSGATSSNWFIPSNWVGDTVPGANANITIDSGIYNPVLTSNISTSDVIIEAGATFNPSTFTLSGTNLDVFGTLLVQAPTFAANYAFSGVTTLEPNSIVNYAALTNQTITHTLSYSYLIASGSGIKTIDGPTTVRANLTNNKALDLDGQSLAVDGTLVNNGTLKLMGNETTTIGTFTDNGTTDYYGSSAYSITPLGTYNNLQFDNGTFELGGSAVFTAIGNVTVDPNVSLDLVANVSLTAGKAFTMDPTATINGGNYNLSITANSASTLGNINNTILFTLNSGSNSDVTFTSNSSSTFNVNTVQTSYLAILSRNVGIGTMGNPIMIYSDSNAPGGLEYINTTGLGLNYNLANNIDATETSSWNNGTGFIPIGNITTPFTGSFNGNSFTINNLTLNTSSNYVGLFGSTSSSGMLSNIQLTNENVKGGNYVGGLVGYNGGSINSADSSGNVSGISYIGGLVGYNENSVNNAFSSDEVSGANDLGGLVGLNNGSISNSNSFGALSGSGNYIGGLVGDNEGSVIDSYSTGNVTANDYVGGLVGYNGNYGVILNSFTIGSVTGTGVHVGGLAGNSIGGITNSYFTDNTHGNEGGGTYEPGGATAFNSWSHPVYALGTANAWTVANSTAIPFPVIAPYAQAIRTWVIDSLLTFLTENGYIAIVTVLTVAVLENYNFYVWISNSSTNWKLPSNWLWNKVPVVSSNNNIIFIYAGNPILPYNLSAQILGILPNASFDPSTNFITGELLADSGTVKVNLQNFQSALGLFANYYFGISELLPSSTVIYTSDEFQQIDNALNYYNLEISGSGQKNLIGAATVGTSLKIDENSSFNLNGYSLNVQGTFTNDGTLILNGNEPITVAAGGYTNNNEGEVIYDGPGSYIGLDPFFNGVTYYNIEFENGTFVLVSPIIVSNTLTIQSGTVDEHGSNIYVGGNWNNTGGVFIDDLGTGTVFLTGSGTITSNTSQGSSFSNLNMYSVGTYIVQNGDGIKVSGNFTQTSGTFIADPTETTFSVSGSFLLLGGVDFDRFTGAGSVGNPYVIYDVYGLQGMRDFLSSNFILQNNIEATVTSKWNTLGEGYVGFEDIYDFAGSFNGEGYTISNLTENGPAFGLLGLFGTTATTAELSNIQLTNVSITGNGQLGGLVGVNEGKITNSNSNGIINGVNDIGGLVGENYGSIAGNSYATGTVNGNFATGGLVGYNDGSIDTTHSTANVNGFEETGGINDGDIGGLVGWNDTAGTINNSISSGIVNGSVGYDVGGLVGSNYHSITNSSSSGNVNGSQLVGGLVGNNEGPSSTISNSFSTGKVSGSTYIGGFAGYNGGNITVSDSTGAVNGSSLVGGFVGSNSGSITSSETTGSVSGISYVGGFEGYNSLESGLAEIYSTTYTVTVTTSGSTTTTTYIIPTTPSTPPPGTITTSPDGSTVTDYISQTITNPNLDNNFYLDNTYGTNENGSTVIYQGYGTYKPNLILNL